MRMKVSVKPTIDPTLRVTPELERAVVERATRARREQFEMQVQDAVLLLSKVVPLWPRAQRRAFAFALCRKPGSPRSGVAQQNGVGAAKRRASANKAAKAAGKAAR